MIFKTRDKQERLGEAQEYYHRAANAASDIREWFKKYDEQYKGSHEIDVTERDDEGELYDDVATVEAVDNITFELIEGSIDTDIPQPSVSPPIKCEHYVRNARRMENMIKRLMDKLPFEEYNDRQERTVKKFGTAGTNVEWDVTVTTRSTVGDVGVEILRPQNFYPQPGITDIDGCDYVFVDYVTTKAELRRRYGCTEEELDKATFGTEYESQVREETMDEDVVTMTVMWYRNDDGSIGRYVYSGDLVLEDDEDYYARRIEWCSACGRRAEICRQEPCKKPSYYRENKEYDELTEDLELSDGRIIPAMSPVIKDGELVLEKVKIPVTNPDGSHAMQNIGGIELPMMMEVEMPKMQPTRLPFYKPKTLPLIIRYNIRDDDSFWGVGDCEVIREDQMRINKLTSRIDEAIKKAGAILGIPEDCEITPSSGIFEEIVRLGPGTTKEQFMLFSYAVDITQWVLERQQVRESAKKKVGVSDAYLGQADNTAKSGYAKSLQIAQSAGRLSAKKIMKQSFYAKLFRVFFELNLAFADEPREIYHEDDCKMAADERFDRRDYYEFDTSNGKWFIDDNYTFAVDMNGAIEQQYPQLWEVVKADYASGMYGAVSNIDTAIMAWQHLEQLKYPFARNTVERMKALKEQMIKQQAMVQSGAAMPGGAAMQSGAAVPAAANAMNGGNINE